MSDGHSDYVKRNYGPAAIPVREPCAACNDTGRVETVRKIDGVTLRGACKLCAPVRPPEPDYTTRTIPVVQPDPFPGDRKTYPVLTGLLRYFPDACAAVANCSHVANEQHNSGEPMHWDREKSIGDGNELLRHLMQAGTLDTDGIRHMAKVAWRALELLQREIEASRK